MSYCNVDRMLFLHLERSQIYRQGEQKCLLYALLSGKKKLYLLVRSYCFVTLLSTMSQKDNTFFFLFLALI